MLELAFHPVTRRFRPLTAEENASLRASLLKHGLIQPIQIWNNAIIDGRSRYQLATELDIPITAYRARLSPDAGEEELLDYVMTLNDPRRLLPVGEEIEAQFNKLTGDNSRSVKEPTDQSGNDPEWMPPQKTSRRNGGSFANTLLYQLINTDASYIYGWFGGNGLACINSLLKSLPRKQAHEIARRIADNVITGNIRWSSGPSSTNLDLRWIVSYLPPRFSRDHSGARKGIASSLAAYIELNDLCRARTTRYELIQKRKDWPAVFVRPASDEAELETFAYAWWQEYKQKQKLRDGPEEKPKLSWGTNPAAEPELPPKSKRSVFEDLPIIYHGRQLWPRDDDPKEPSSPDYPTREDVEVAYRLAVDYLRRIRAPRGPDPKLDAMDLRQMFKYLRKLKRPLAVLRVLNEIAYLVDNNIGTDAQNSAPPFEINISQ